MQKAAIPLSLLCCRFFFSFKDAFLAVVFSSSTGFSGPTASGCSSDASSPPSLDFADCLSAPVPGVFCSDSSFFLEEESEAEDEDEANAGFCFVSAATLSEDASFVFSLPPVSFAASEELSFMLPNSSSSVLLPCSYGRDLRTCLTLVIPFKDWRSLSSFFAASLSNSDAKYCILSQAAHFINRRFKSRSHSVAFISPGSHTSRDVDIWMESRKTELDKATWAALSAMVGFRATGIMCGRKL
mmetsp:Transcript_59624/g.146159  ORF Transcript_59624/g.146159 Transcript_59624/m.146159 type:complete len:242 (+) Transcript_59624:5207-5932(+)